MTGCTSSRGGGYFVNTNAYISGFACGPWWVPYNNTLGYTHTSATAFGAGTFSAYTGCSSIGGGRTLNIVQGQLTFMYYYSSNYLITITPQNPAAPFPPPRVANSGGTLLTTAWVYLQSIKTSAQAGIGYRQWIYVVPAGGCAACPNKAVNSVLILLCDAGLGLRVMQNVGFEYPNWSVNMIASTGSQTGQANTVDVTGYVKAPNNDHALLGLMIQLVAGSTTALVTSATGNIYSFDVSSLSWNNGGYPVYSAGLGNVYRGILAAPRPLDEPGTFCRSLPRNSQTAGGYDVQWPDGYVLAGSTTSGTWGSQNAPVYATASFGCYAGKWSTVFTTISCSLASGWPAPAPPACQNCAAAPGSYCPPNTRSAAGVPCPEGNYCTGGTAQPLFCLAPGGYYCPPGTAFNSPLGWAACPYGSTCAGGNAWPEAFNPIRRNSLLVVRVGDGVVNYGAGTQPVFIDEYDASTTPSSLLQTFAFPITANGAQQPFSLLPQQRGTAVPNGHLTLSADERFVTLAGFAAPPGTPISALRGPGVPRVIARMDWQGNIDTSTTTVLGDNSAIGSATVFSIVSACSYDGSGFVFTTDYVPNPANLSDGTPLLVNYQAFGTNVSSLAQVKTFSSPLALARSTSVIGAAFLGAAQPILGPTDGWDQCQYVDNRLVISHTWGSVATSLPNALGDLSVANATGPITDANLDVDFSQRYTWSPSVKGAAGFAFFDNGQHLAICDRGNSIAIFADNGRGDKCMGSANETSASPNINYTTPTLSSTATGATSIIDTSKNCHSIAASRDGLGIFFTTDSQLGYSRLFRIGNWVPGGGTARPVTQWIPCNNWWYWTPGTTTVNADNNRCGVVNNFWYWFGAAAAPSLAGVSQTPQFAQGQTCPAGYALASGGASCSICLANTFSTSVNSASCAACPSNSATSLYGQTSCVCNANFTSVGSGASLVCTACPADATSAPGSSTCVCTDPWGVYQPGSNTCYLAPSATPSPTQTPSQTPTPSASTTATATPTPSTTESVSATASLTPSRSETSTSSLSSTPSPTATTSPSRTSTPTPTVTPTASNTPTASVTASPTSLPDSLLVFSFVIAPAPGAGLSLPVNAIVAYPAVSSAIRATFASYLGVSLGSVGIANVSDVATGAQANLAGLGLSGGRRLQRAAAGSMGVRISIRANLGKAPSQAALNSMVTNLQGAPSSLFAPIISPLVTYYFDGSAATASKLGGAVETSTITLANTNLIVLPAAGALAASSASSGDSSSTTGVGVGLGVGLTVLFLAIWSWRSWTKHGVLPCFRDRAAEKRKALADTAARGEVVGINPIGGGEAELTIRALAMQVAEQKAEVDRLNAQRLAERAVANAGRESLMPVAGARSILRAEEAAKQAVQRAQFAPGGV